MARDVLLIRNVINDPHISKRRERSPHKVGWGDYTEGLYVEDFFLALIGLSLLWQQVSLSLFLSTLRPGHVITLEVLCSKCVTGKLHWSKNTLACAFPIVSHLSR